MSLGKKIRLSSWLKNGRTFLVALDEVVPQGLTAATEQLENELLWLVKSPVDAIVLHPGIAVRFGHIFAHVKPWIAKLTTNSYLIKDRRQRAIIGSVPKAVKLGASGVAVNVFVGSPFEKEQMEFLAECVSDGETWGMPVIAFISPPPEKQFDTQALIYNCRVGVELGVDVVKTDFPGDYEEFKQVIEQALTPIIIEYAPLPETEKDTLDIVRGVVQADGAGVNFGSRLINSPGKQKLAEEIAQIIHC